MRLVILLVGQIILASTSAQAEWQVFRERDAFSGKEEVTAIKRGVRVSGPTVLETPQLIFGCSDRNSFALLVPRHPVSSSLASIEYRVDERPPQRLTVTANTARDGAGAFSRTAAIRMIDGVMAGKVVLFRIPLLSGREAVYRFETENFATARSVVAETCGWRR
jgi:hypothetical protein